MKNSHYWLRRILSWIDMFFVVYCLELIGTLAAIIVPTMLLDNKSLSTSDPTTIIVSVISAIWLIAAIFIEFKYFPKIIINLSERVCKSIKGTRYLLYSILLILFPIITLAFAISTGEGILEAVIYLNRALIGISLLFTYKGVIHKGYYTPQGNSNTKQQPSTSIIEETSVSSPEPVKDNNNETINSSATPFEEFENYEQLELNLDSITPPAPEEPKKKFGFSKIVIALLLVSNIVTSALAINNYNANKISVEKFVAEREAYNDLQEKYSAIEEECQEITTKIYSLHSICFDSNHNSNSVESKLSDLFDMSLFYDNHACIVSGVSGNKYHKYSCQYVDNFTNFYIFNIENAKSQGYEPCSVCFSKIKKIYIAPSTFSEWTKRKQQED